MEIITLSQILSIGIVGALMSTLFEIINSEFQGNPRRTKLIVIALSVAVGSGYVFIKDTPYFTTVITVLGAASTMYSFFFSGKK